MQNSNTATNAPACPECRKTDRQHRVSLFSGTDQGWLCTRCGHWGNDESYKLQPLRRSAYQHFLSMAKWLHLNVVLLGCLAMEALLHSVADAK
jgi:transposase-like protein